MAKVATPSSECAEALKTLLGAAGCLEAEERSRKPLSFRVTATVFTLLTTHSCFLLDTSLISTLTSKR